MDLEKLMIDLKSWVETQKNNDKNMLIQHPKMGRAMKILRALGFVFTLPLLIILLIPLLVILVLLIAFLPFKLLWICFIKKQATEEK